MSQKPHSIRLLRDDSTLANQGAGKTIEKPLKDLRWNQQNMAKPHSVESCNAMYQYEIHISTP